MSDEVKGPARVVKSYVSPNGEEYEGALLIGDQLFDSESHDLDGTMEEKASVINAALSPLISAAEERGRVKGIEESAKAICSGCKSGFPLIPLMSSPAHTTGLGVMVCEAVSIKALSSTTDGKEKAQ